MLITHLLWTMRSRSLRDRRVAASHRTGPCQQPPTGPRALPARTDGGVAANLRRIPATGRPTEIAVHNPSPPGTTPRRLAEPPGVHGPRPAAPQVRKAPPAEPPVVAKKRSVEADQETVGSPGHRPGELVQLVRRDLCGL